MTTTQHDASPEGGGGGGGSALQYLLSLLNTAFPGGIPISQLFNAVNIIPTHTPPIRGLNALWQVVLQRDDIILSNGNQLRESPLKKLSYDEVLSLGLGSNELRLRAAIHPQSTEAHEKVGSGTGFIQKPVMEPPSIPTEPSLAPEDDTSSIPPQANTTSSFSGLDSGSTTKSASGRAAAKATPKNRGKRQTLLLQSGVSVEQPDSGHHSTPHNDTAAASPSTSSVTPKTPSRRGRVPSSAGASTRRTPRSGDERPVREAVFTSQAELDYKDGLPGVYMNLPGTDKPRAKWARKSATSIAVFKSPALKDPDYLTKNRGSWVPYVAELLQKDVDDVKMTTKPPPKRNPNPKPHTKKRNNGFANFQALQDPQLSMVQNSETGAWGSAPLIFIASQPKRSTKKINDTSTPASSATFSSAQQRRSNTPLILNPLLWSAPDPITEVPRVSQAPGSYVQWGAPQAPSSTNLQSGNQRDTPMRDMTPSSMPLPTVSNSPAPAPSFSWKTAHEHPPKALPPPPNAAGFRGLESQPDPSHFDDHLPTSVHSQSGSSHAEPIEQNTGSGGSDLPEVLKSSRYASISAKMEVLGQKPSYASPYATSPPRVVPAGPQQVPTPNFALPNTGVNVQPPSFPNMPPSSSAERPSLPANSMQIREIPLGVNEHRRGSPARPVLPENTTHHFQRDGHPQQNREPMTGVPFTSGDPVNVQQVAPSNMTSFTHSNLGPYHYSQPSGGPGVPYDPSQISFDQTNQNQSYGLQPHPVPPQYPYPAQYNANFGAAIPQPYHQWPPQGTPLSAQTTGFAYNAPQTPHVGFDWTPSEATAETTAMSPESSFTPLGVMSSPLQDDIPGKAPAKGRTLRKRKKPSTTLDDDVPETSKPKARKTRNNQTPSQPDPPEITPRKSARQTRTEKELEDSLLLAEECEIPDDLVRFACVFEHKYVGNLILSKDLTTLEFFGIAQHPPLVPLLMLPILEILDNPITSVRGSKPMQLVIKVVKPDEEEPVSHSFIYGSSPERAEAAAEMRKRIMVAITAEKLRTGEGYVRPSEARERIVRPFLCEKCGGRFKNINGLQYHQTKSQTACNPGFDPSTRPPKVHRGGRRKKAEKPTEDSEPEFVEEDGDTSDPETSKRRRPRRGTKAKKSKTAKSADLGILSGDEDTAHARESSSDSEDSVMEWARQTAGINDMPEPAKPARIYKAFNRETQILKDILRSFHGSEGAEQTSEFPPAPSPFTTGLPTLSEIADAMSSSEDLTETICREMILALLPANNGILPGNKSIWLGCAALWLKKHPTTNVIPRSTLVNKCTDDLLDEGKLLTEPFDYMGLRSRKLVGTLIFTPGADTKSSGCKMLQNLVQACTPRIYIPSHLAPPPGVLDGLQKLAGRLIPNPDPPPPKKVEVEEDEDLAEFDMHSPEPEDRIYFDEDSTDDEFHIEDEEEENAVDLDMDLDEEEVSSLQDNNAPKKGGRRRRSSLPLGRRHRNPGHNAKISQAISARWNAIRAGKLPAPDNSKRQQKKNEAQAYRNKHMWTTLPAFMPNPQTGAWGVPTEPESKQEQGWGGERRRFGTRISQLAEPITYLQAMDGSWSVRAFGHGVKPVFARPARRADGNPNLGAHLKRIGEGYRPVAYPDRAMMGPHIPSKVLLRKNALAQGLPVEPILKSGSQKRKVDQISSGTADNSMDANSELGEDQPQPRQKRKYVWKNPRAKNAKSAVRQMQMSAVETMHPEYEKRKPDAPLNLGLETVPPSLFTGERGVDGSELATSDLLFIPQKSVGDIAEGSEQYSWSLRGPYPTAGYPYQVQWDDNQAFTAWDLPYDDLRYDSDKEKPQFIQEEVLTPETQEAASPVQAPTSKRRRLTKGKQPAKYIPVAQRALMKERSEKTRQQLALTTDFTGLGKDPDEMAAKFGVETTEPNEAARKRKRHASTTMSQADENRFIIAVIVQRILTGGKEMYIDWVLISTLFQHHSMSFLVHYWRSICDGKEDVLAKITRDFRAAYPTAYKNGLVPKFNWDKLLDNDWNGLIRWVQANVVTPFGNSNDVLLPSTRKEVLEQYEMKELDVIDDWRETYYSLGAAKYKKVEAAATLPKAVPVTKPFSTSIDEDRAEIDRCARSWARAVALTPVDDWDAAPASVRNKLKNFGEKVATRAFESLIQRKVLMHRNKGRALPGRSHEGTDAFYATLRRHMKESQFVEAMIYKQWMDEEFRAGAPCLMVDYMGNEGSVMVLTSLQAHGHIKIECQNVPREKFGLTESGYETKSIPREKITFEMTITPTATYVYDDDNYILSSIFFTTPPKDEQGGKIPVWYGISGVLIPDMWKRVIVAVSQIMALRTGINLDSLVQVFKPTMERWELKMFVDWGVEVGLFKRVHPTIEGWTVSEWWWAVAGRLCTMYNDDDVV